MTVIFSFFLLFWFSSCYQVHGGYLTSAAPSPQFLSAHAFLGLAVSVCLCVISLKMWLMCAYRNKWESGKWSSFFHRMRDEVWADVRVSRWIDQLFLVWKKKLKSLIIYSFNDCELLSNSHFCSSYSNFDVNDVCLCISFSVSYTSRTN